jgi:uncharacterized iron-regulated protein
MRASLSLQLSVYKAQQALIDRAIEGKTKAFRAYEARYRRRTRSFERAVSRRQVHQAAARADVVYVGDYHTLRAAQQGYLSLVEGVLGAGRRTVLALEFVEGRHQQALDAFLAGALTQEAFLTRIGHPYSGGFDIWPGFRPILELARQRKLQVVAIDSRATGPRSLHKRDAYAAERIAQALGAADRPRVMVLVGEFHIAPCHLPAAVRQRRRGEPLEELVVYQSCHQIWWELARRRRARPVEAVRLRPGELGLLTSSPLLFQQSFLDYLEAESGDHPLGGEGAQARFRDLARRIGSFFGIEVKGRLDELEIVTVATPRLMERIARRGRLGPRELEQVRQQILSRQSYYIPRARTAFLASLSLNHAAEEAAHFVRHCAVGEQMERPRRPADAFYARCLEEAIGFLGSRLVNPTRRCRGLAEWAALFERARGEDRQVAAFVLAHKAAESEGPAHTAQLLPLRQGRLFNGVSHALCYLLGDALHRAVEGRRITKPQLRGLLRDPLEDARGRYFELVGRFGG